MLSIIFSIVSAVIAIFTITSLLNWFITIPFHLPEISYAGAFGMTLIVPYYSKRGIFQFSEEVKGKEAFVMFVLIINLLLLVVGYATKYFLM